jgi:chromosome segregation ATPase
MLTSAQIKKMLKPMADFMPAMLAIQEMLESAEAAEAKQAEFAKEMPRLLQGIKELEASRVDFEHKMQAAKQEMNAAIADRDAKMVELNETLKPLIRAHQDMKKETDRILAQRQEQINAKARQLIELEDKYKRVSDSLAKFAQDHGMRV